MLSGSADAALLFDAQGRPLYANAAATRLLAVRPQETDGERWDGLDLAAAGLEQLEEDRARVADSGVPVRNEARAETSEGKRDFEYILTPVLDAAGHVETVVANVRDVTARKAAEAERAELLERERTARARAERAAVHTARLQSITAVLSRTSTTAAVVEVIRDKALPALGAHAGAVALLEGHDLELAATVGYSAEVVERWRRFPVHTPTPLAEAVRTGEPVLIPTADALAERFPALARSPSPEHRSWAALPLIGVLGPLGGLALSFVEAGERDREEVDFMLSLAGQCAQALERVRLGEEARAATEAREQLRAEAEAARAAAEERAQAAQVLAAVRDGVVLVDQEGLVRLWNRGAEAITGITAQEADAARIEEVSPGWASLMERVAVAPMDEPGRAQTLPLEVAGRELWLSVSAVSVADGTVYAFRDVTEEQALEHARRDLVATASHELRTPVGAVYGAARTLLTRDLPEEQRAGLLTVIATQSERLAGIVDQLFFASRLDEGAVAISLTSVDGVALAREVVDRARERAPRSVHLLLAAPEAPIAVRCDEDRLRQVLANLVDNAIKYSPDGGPVEVAVGRDGELVRFDVHDEGMGIPAAEQERIFEKFYRLDPDLTSGVGGIGLGLYICRELVARMGGRISLTSDERAGSTFRVELPAA